MGVLGVGGGLGGVVRVEFGAMRGAKRSQFAAAKRDERQSYCFN